MSAPSCAASGCNAPQGECLGICRQQARPAGGDSVSLEVHDRICQDLYRQIRGLIVDSERLRADILAEREACARLCEQSPTMIGLMCAAAIRGRGRA